MGHFAYRAYAADGRTRAGKVEAETRQRAVALLQGEGLRVFAIEPAAAGPDAFWKRDLFGRDRVNDAARVAFLREFGTLLGAGLTVDRALRLTERQASKALRPVLTDLLERVVGGASLSRAMGAHPQAFPQDMVDIVRAGEATGTLTDVIASLTASIARRDAVRRHLASAMIYPGLLVLMAIGTIAMIVGVLVPALAPMFEGSGQARPSPSAPPGRWGISSPRGGPCSSAGSPPPSPCWRGAGAGPASPPPARPWPCACPWCARS